MTVVFVTFDDDWEEDRDDWRDDWADGRAFPGEGCMPGDHFRSECFTAAMAEEYREHEGRP